jgi:hypothetical protein
MKLIMKDEAKRFLNEPKSISVRVKVHGKIQAWGLPYTFPLSIFLPSGTDAFSSCIPICIHTHHNANLESESMSWRSEDWR